MIARDTLDNQLRAAFRHRARLVRFERAAVPAVLKDGKYSVKLEPCLGSGGTADVYEAEDTTTGYRVVVKFLCGSAAWPEEFVELGRAEVQNLARVANTAAKSVVVPIDFDRDPASKLVYIVMSRANGRPLHQIPTEELTSALLEAWMLRTAIAIRACHAIPIRHSDLKPSNILTEMTGEVSVIDFGVSVLLANAPLNLGSTPEYESPEQWRSRRNGNPEEVGLPTDIYSFGVVFDEAWDRWKEAGRRRSVPAPIRSLLNECRDVEPGNRPDAVTLERTLAALEPRRRRTLRRFAIVGLVFTAAAIILAGSFYHRQQGAERRAEVARDDRDRLAELGRAGRASYYKHALVPSAKAVKEFRLLERPAGEYLTNYKAQVTEFQQQIALDSTLADECILLLAQTQITLLENLPFPQAIHDTTWDEVAKSLGPAVVADLLELRGLCLHRDGKTVAARDCYVAALRALPGRSVLHFRLSASWASDRQYAAATRELTAFLNANGAGVGAAVRDRVLRDAHWIRASIRLFKLDDPHGAYQDMQAFFTLHAKTEVKLDDASLSMAHSMRAEAAFVLGRDAEAATEYSAAAARMLAYGVKTDEDRLYVSDCYIGVLMALSSSRPDDALLAAREATKNLPAVIPPGPFRLAGARIALHEGIARLRRPDATRDDNARALTEFSDAEKQYEAVGLGKLTDGETYEYALSLVTRAGNQVKASDRGSSLDVYRQGVKLMSGPASRNPRYQTSHIVATLGLTAMLTFRAIRPEQGTPAEREALAREAANWCKELEPRFGGLFDTVYDQGTCLYLRCMHRSNWIQAAAVLRDSTALAQQGQALFGLCLPEENQKLVATMSPARQQLIHIPLVLVGEEFARQYLLNPSDPDVFDPRTVLKVVVAITPARASSSIYAAAAAAHSRHDELGKAASLQEKAISKAADSSKGRWSNDLRRYKEGRPYEPPSQSVPSRD